MVALPVAGVVARAFGSTALGTAPSWVQHLNLWLAFLGAALAAREGKLLQMATGQFLPENRAGKAVRIAIAALGALVCGLLARAGYELVLLEREFGTTKLTESIPLWKAQVVLPLGLALVGLRIAWRSDEGWPGRLVSLIALAAGVWIAGHWESFEGAPSWPFVVGMIAAALLGAPLFVALGGAAVFLFMTAEFPSPPASVSSEMYTLAASPFLAAVPLFTLAGYVLTLGGAPQRLLAVFRAWFGWMPGGTAIVAVLLCTFFTTFTGGSGVTILALGGLLGTTLAADRYDERFSVGLLTSSGSLGLLFPPALPLILYAIAAGVAIEELFVAGILPGTILVVLVILWALRAPRTGPIERTPFRLREALGSVWAARYEIVIPVVALIALFGGFATPVEAAAITAAFTLLAELVLHRDVSFRRDAVPTLVECVSVLGGVLVILTCAQGLSGYMVDVELPQRLLDFVQANVESKLAFLLCLNLFLLVVGCFLDIYSATFVVVPMLLPLGAAYGIDPVHLGIIFVANLELGYLTPPVGLNLFLGSYRFEQPLTAVYRATLPMLLILGAGVLAITYIWA